MPIEKRRLLYDRNQDEMGKTSTRGGGWGDCVHREASLLGVSLDLGLGREAAAASAWRGVGIG
jgi:hypothetical protein